jgi:hypothetical protein
MSYQVKPGEGEITVHSGASQKLQFTVNNTSDRPILTQTELRVGGAVDPAWCSVDPATDTNLEGKGSRTFTVTVAPKNVTKATSGHVQLAAASVDDPSHATPSPEVRVTILPAQSAPTWWQRYGKYVLIGAGVLLIGVVAAVLLSSNGLAIEEFKATPAAGAPAGEPIVLSWKLEGKAQAVVLALGSEAPTPLAEELWKEGPYEITSLTPGPLTVRLTATEDVGDEDEGVLPGEISEGLNLTITERARTFAAPAITSFAVTPPNAMAGQPVRFAWATTGDVMMLTIDFGSGAPPTVTDPARLAEGSHEQPLLAGNYSAIAKAVGKDGTSVQSQAVSFVVNEDVSLEAPKVDLSATATGRVVKVGGGAPSLKLSWNVVGEHTGLQVSFLVQGATPTMHDLASNSGEQTFKNVFVPEGSIVQLFVARRSGPRLVYECEVGKGRIQRPPREFERVDLELEPPISVRAGERVIHTLKPRELMRLEGGG